MFKGGKNGSKSVKSSLLTYSADSNQKWLGQRNNKKKKRKEKKEKKWLGQSKFTRAEPQEEPLEMEV